MVHIYFSSSTKHILKMLTLEFTKQAICEEFSWHVFSFFHSLGCFHKISFPFSKLDMFSYSPLSSKVHQFSYTLLHLKWITNKDLLYSVWNSAQCDVAACMGGVFEREWIHVYVWLSPFTIHLKLSQYCELAILKYKIKSYKKIKTNTIYGFFSDFFT